jgi:hypothetical protein
LTISEGNRVLLVTFVIKSRPLRCGRRCGVRSEVGWRCWLIAWRRLVDDQWRKLRLASNICDQESTPAVRSTVRSERLVGAVGWLRGLVRKFPR